jgi:hypothetical protein
MQEIVTQGDIIKNCPVIIPVENGYEEIYPYFGVKGGNIDAIVMTQACDLENKTPKVDEITLCPIEPVTNFLKSEMEKIYKDKPDFDYFNLIPKQKKKKSDIFQDIRKGNYLNFYLLNKKEEFDLDYHIVNLRKSYKIPVNSLNKIVKEKKGEKRLRLLPPYREHLSHAFSFNFSRIGLPEDISITDEELNEI